MSRKPYRADRGPFYYSWKFFEALIVLAAIAVGFSIWLMPNWKESDTFKKLESAVMERREARLKYEAQVKAEEEERERLGLVYFGPGAVPIVEDETAAPPKPAP